MVAIRHYTEPLATKLQVVTRSRYSGDGRSLGASASVRISGFRRRSIAVGVCVAALASALAACSDSGSKPSASAPPPGVRSTAVSRYTTPLKGICPDTVVVQANWWPEASRGFVYQLLGPNPTIDKNKNRVIGQLGGTGVALEIRAGGPAVGFQPVPSLLAQDDSILLGDVNTDEAIQGSGKVPTVAVFSAYEKNPQVLLWGNPDWNFTNVADIGRAGAPVLVTAGTAYLDVFEREGLLNASQTSTAYQGSPDRFVVADGKIVQQGFVTNEPYRLEHDVKAWSKPVKFLLLHDEYPVYQNALAIRPDKLAANRACLAKLVPLFQRAQRDYITTPGPTNQLLLDVVSKLNTSGFGLSAGLLAASNAKQKDLGLIANGSDGVLGSFDAPRVQKLIGRLVPVFEAKGAAPKSGLTSADLVTNEFLDKSISLK